MQLQPNVFLLMCCRMHSRLAVAARVCGDLAGFSSTNLCFKTTPMFVLLLHFKFPSRFCYINVLNVFPVFADYILYYSHRTNAIAVAQQQQTNNVINVIVQTFCPFHVHSEICKVIFFTFTLLTSECMWEGGIAVGNMVSAFLEERFFIF